jgi:hypothetical protein
VISAAAATAVTVTKSAGGSAACPVVERDYTGFLAGTLKPTAAGERTFDVLTAALAATYAGDVKLANFPDKDIDALAAASAAIAYVGVLDEQNAAWFNQRLAVVAGDCGITLKPLAA